MTPGRKYFSCRKSSWKSSVLFVRAFPTSRLFFCSMPSPKRAGFRRRIMRTAWRAPTPHRSDIMECDENSLAELFYTSGTSANPKGVMLTHRNIYLHALSVVSDLYGVTPDSVNLHTIPLFHANGWGVPPIQSPCMGGNMSCFQRFVPCAEVFQSDRARARRLAEPCADHGNWHW